MFGFRPFPEKQRVASRARRIWDKVRLTVVLALVGGCVDAVGYLVLFQMFTAHMSGNSIALTVYLGQGQWDTALRRGFPIPLFVAGVGLGAALSEGLIRSGFRSTFAAALGLESLLLLVFLLGGSTAFQDGRISPDPAWRFYLLAALPALAMGLQSAALRRAGGALVYTTFITGMLTSFAEEAVQFLFWFVGHARGPRRKPLHLLLRLSLRQGSFHRMLLRLAIWLAYVAGGIAGTVAELRGGLLFLLAPALALACIAVADLLRPIYPPSTPGFIPDWKE